MRNANLNYIDDKVESEFLNLSDEQLKNITRKNFPAKKKENRNALLACGTMASLLIYSKPIAWVFDKIGYETISQNILDETYFVNHVVVGGLALAAHWVYSHSGERYKELIKFNSVLNILDKRKEAEELGGRYLRS